MRRTLRLAGPHCLVLAAALLPAGCGSAARAPVYDVTRPSAAAVPEPRPETPVPAEHQVVRGDTLFSIAWRYGLDWRDVAAWNGIREPYLIVPGQHVRLRPPAPVAKKEPAPRPAPATPPKPAAKPPPRQPAPRPAVTADLRWQWPAKGQVLHSNSLTSRNGVDISGHRGQSIVAAAAGAVVYSGTGLRGYGRLIIIKHNDAWLSAYAHNERLLVKEGDRVDAGEQIATMGLGNDGRPVLHFEIRKDGKPVNPLDYLPKRPS
jgi:lipoprotein NlpD